MPEKAVMVQRNKFPVPWGLFIVLVLYALGVWAYVWLTVWQSPEYVAAQHSERATELLGVDEGRTASGDALRVAFDEVLEAARLLPEEEQFAERLERLRGRFAERRLRLDPERVHRAEAVSASARRVREARAPVLVVGARDRKWAPDQLAEKPRRIFLWSLPGAVLVIAIWAYLAVTAYVVRARDHAASAPKN